MTWLEFGDCGGKSIRQDWGGKKLGGRYVVSQQYKLSREEPHSKLQPKPWDLEDNRL